MKRLLIFVLALVLTVSVVGMASAQGTVDPGVGYVNFTVMNLSDSSQANVEAAYVNQAGGVDVTVPKTVEPLSSQGFQAAESGLPDNWVGSVIVSSDQPIVAFAQMKWQNGTSSDGKTSGAYNAFTQGVNKLYFPSLAARTGKQFSRLTIQSADAASATETVDFFVTFYDRQGNKSLGPQKYTINAGTQTTIDLLSDVSLPVTTPPGDGWLGSAVVTSTQPIAGVATTHWAEYSAAYSAVTGGGADAYLPSATRRLSSTSGAWLQYTGVVVQNLDPTQDATVVVHWYDREGTELYSFNDTIPANSAHGYNTRHTAGDVPNPTELHDSLGSNWNGSVYIESTNAVDIVAIANLQWTVDHPAGAGASAYYSEPSGYEEIFVPAIFRRVDTNNWLQYTGLIVQNVGDAQCTDFTVQWRDRSGNVLVEYQDSLAPNIAHGYNSRVRGDIPTNVNLDDLGTSLNGSVYISAPGCSLIAIHNTVWPAWTDSTTYNAFGQ